MIQKKTVENKNRQVDFESFFFNSRITNMYYLCSGGY